VGFCVPPLLFLFAAGVLGGGMNALAGGGSFVTLPAMIAVGVPAVQANASSTVALWPGGAASVLTYRPTDGRVCGVPIAWMAAISLVGGLLGAVLLLTTPSSAFEAALPWLLLAATLALAFGRRIAEAAHGRLRDSRAAVVAAQFGLGVYGGYFGGAVGLMMIAVWSLFGESDIKALNGPRTLMVSAANTIAAIAFALAGAVRWPETLALLLGGLVGGVAGARLGRVMPTRLTRLMTIGWTTAVTAVFLVRAYVR
jgi:hypothetical protein